MNEQYAPLLERIKSAYHSGQALNISGAGSKSFYGRTPVGEILDVSGNRGIVDYDPAELVIVAQAGTPLTEVQSALAEKKQMLGFEPPFSDRGATLGGTIASGLAGSGRPYRGGTRDYLLGTKIISGKGEVNQFGGRVMKNVAGFDLFRPMAGAMGTLGVLLEVSLRVMPIPEQELDLQFGVEKQAAALQLLCHYGSQLPSLSAASWHQGIARVRLSGSHLLVKRDRALLEGEHEVSESDPDIRSGIEHMTDNFFTQLEDHSCIAALDLAPATEPLELEGEWLIDWGGARRYLKTELPITEIRKLVTAAEGSATLVQGGDRNDCFHPLAENLMNLHMRLKQAFDPRGIFNPGRLYAEL